MSPQRTCIGCRGRDDQDQLLRLVRVGDEIVDGTRPRLPGRGAYLHPRASCLEVAVRRRAFPRTFGAGAAVAPGLAGSLGAISPGWNPTPPSG